MEEIIVVWVDWELLLHLWQLVILALTVESTSNDGDLFAEIVVMST